MMADQTPTPARRLSLSQVVELLLTRGSHDRSSVTLARNAKGETQIEVVVRTGDGDGAVQTVLDAEQVAADVYVRLRARFPLASGYVDNGVPRGGEPAGGAESV